MSLHRPEAAAAAIDDIHGAPAIEVAALLGDSVVDVKHCIDPRSGRITRITWGLLATCAVLLVLATIAFAVSVHVAALNQADLDHWTRDLHRPAFAFRGRELGAGVDWIALGGYAVAIAAGALGLARWRGERRTPYYRIGTAPGVELAVADAPAAAFPLVAPSASGNSFVFTYAPGIDGELVHGGTVTTLADLAATGRGRASACAPGAVELPIPIGGKIRARAGKATFAIAAIAPPRRHAAPLFAPSSRASAYIAASLVAHVALIALLAQVPMGDSSAAIDLGELYDPTINVTGTVRETPPPLPSPDADSAADTGASSPSPVAIAVAPGTPDSTAAGRLAIKNANVPPEVSRQQAIEEARTAGIMSSLSATSFAPLTGTGDVTSGWDDATFAGSLNGTEVGPGYGMFGGGISSGGAPGGGGYGPGGGGRGGLIGSGNYGTCSGGKACGEGRHTFLQMPNHHAAVPTVSMCSRTCGVEGTLDKEIVRRYIHRNIDKITYCYEHELIARPSLEGEVVAQFFIMPSGKVQGATAAGFDGAVASCVASVVGDIEFPKSDSFGQSGTMIKYPFTFHAAH